MVSIRWRRPDCDSSLGVTSYLNGVGLDELFLVNNGTNQSFLRDGMNSTIALTDSSGTIVHRTTYDPYGNTTDSAPSQASPFEFAGRENEGNLGYYYSNLYFMRGRYYDASIGRFISRDPAGVAGGVNLYAYAGDSPTNFCDPVGFDYFGGGYYGYGNGAFPGVETGAGPSVGGGGGVVGGFVYQGLAVLASEGGLDNDVVQFYDGSQNGGGLQNAEDLPSPLGMENDDTRMAGLRVGPRPPASVLPGPPPNERQPPLGKGKVTPLPPYYRNPNDPWDRPYRIPQYRPPKPDYFTPRRWRVWGGF